MIVTGASAAPFTLLSVGFGKTRRAGDGLACCGVVGGAGELDIAGEDGLVGVADDSGDKVVFGGVIGGASTIGLYP